MAEKTTLFALEDASVSILLVNGETTATCLRSVGRRHEQNVLSPFLCFVCEQSTKLEICPVTPSSIERLSSPLLPYPFQVFQCKRPIGERCNFFRQRMVEVQHEPSLSTGKRAKFSLCRASA